MQAHSTKNETFTVSDGLLKTLSEIGVQFIFANLGSDHPAVLESLAKANENQASNLPRVIVCPHEMVALSAAHGFAQATGKMQAVFVHVDVGTQNMGGALHNAMRGRVPIFIFAGASPATLDGEATGSRNEFIHYLQDVFDQRGIVRGYTKWDYTLHLGQNVNLVVKRAAQIASSEPRGPVYLMAPRDILEQSADESVEQHSPQLKPLHPSALSSNQVYEILSELTNANRPLIITSYLGRNPSAVYELETLSNRLAVPVMEAGPFYMNFPADHPLHLGYEDFINKNTYLESADVVLVLDSDIPWMPQTSKILSSLKLYWIDSDPLKEDIPMWYYAGQKAIKADSGVALKQLNEALDDFEVNESKVNLQRTNLMKEHRKRADERVQKETTPENGVITPEFLTRVIRETIDDSTIVVNETISNYGATWRHLQRTIPGTFFGSGASSLGWHGGAAIGMKLAYPDKTVVALTGDGAFLFSVPSAVQLVANQFNAPFLTVIFNNGGWKSPKLSTLAVHPDGAAARNSDFHVSFLEQSNLEQVAGSIGDTCGFKVSSPTNLRETLKKALDIVQHGNPAVVNVILQKL
ncbi:thiamine pyrophosphate-requiring protein [Alicyclobacillus sp. SO9]|uniref:thiamine pyrophosphate-requiring protein n=1 Tax=Alicyclobacillus sp. SO9 TaxID=2665646 RepID=UPI0018E85267|nr:thiamine pyrophosphate-requiring protein [Alicyclobacillus sp. SO9]QQE81436.1 thiamine pyrophosphate-requiring protein [Alicyclobacillus sp. SO9]